MVGHTLSEKTKGRISKTRILRGVAKGNLNPRFGKQSEFMMNYWKTHEHPMKGRCGIFSPTYGRHLSIDEKNRISNTKKNLFKSGKIVHWCSGKSCSVIRKKKQSETMIRKYSSGELVSPFKGMHHTIKTRRILSDNHKGLLIGEKHGQWKGGTSRLPYGYDFRFSLKELVRENYNRECVMCFKPENGLRLDIHHIDKNKNNNKLENLLPVHHGFCHKLAESIE